MQGSHALRDMIHETDKGLVDCIAC